MIPFSQYVLIPIFPNPQILEQLQRSTHVGFAFFVQIDKERICHGFPLRFAKVQELLFGLWFRVQPASHHFL